MVERERPGQGRRRPEISLAGIGFDLAASVGVGALLGWWIDRRFETAPWGVVICSSVAIIGGLLNFVRSAQAAFRQDQIEQEARDEEPRSDVEE